MHSILIVDDEKAIRTMLLDSLEDTYHIVLAETGEAALNLCAQQSFDMVISDINMPGMKGYELLREIKKRHPKTITLLITAYNINDYVRMAKQFGICNIVPKTSPFNFHELHILINALLTREIFGLARYLGPDATMLGTYAITSTMQAREVRDSVAERFVELFGTSGEMKLIMDEVLTNAIYHAPTNPDGSPKYTEFAEIQLQPHEVVYLEFGHDREKYGVGIADQQGHLTKETVLYKIDRHINEEGILDDSGRGIHMSRLFADRMIINIQPNSRTEVILMNYFSDTYRGFKPLYINEL